MVHTIPERLDGQLDPWSATEFVDGLTDAVVVCDATGVVRLTNAAAGRLLPEVRTGERLDHSGVTPLAHAVGVSADAFEGDHRGRPLRGRCRHLPGGRSAWLIRDVSGEYAPLQPASADGHRAGDRDDGHRDRDAGHGNNGHRDGEDARLARTLRDSLQLPELPAIPGVTLAGGYCPAGGYRPAGGTALVGGDFYEVFPAGSGGIFALGDVCGKGVEAAVLSNRVRQSLNALRLVERRPRRLLELLNQALLSAPDQARRSQFTTLLVGALTRAGDGMRVTVAGGGHPAPLVARATGAVAPLRVGGMPVGAFQDAAYREVHLRLGPGDMLVAYSDGILEARGGPDGAEFFGEDRLREELRSCADQPADAVVSRLLRVVGEWLGGNPRDDITLLAVGVPGDAPGK
jgi:hypothetical protein